jgi:hypothetical protein
MAAPRGLLRRAAAFHGGCPGACCLRRLEQPTALGRTTYFLGVVVLTCRESRGRQAPLAPPASAAEPQTTTPGFTDRCSRLPSTSLSVTPGAMPLRTVPTLIWARPPHMAACHTRSTRLKASMATQASSCGRSCLFRGTGLTASATHLEGQPIARGIVYGDRCWQLLVDLDCEGGQAE